MCPRYIYRTLLFILLFSTGIITVQAEAISASNVVESFHSTLLDIMQNADKLGFEGRYDKMAPVIHDKFDTPLISQVILSRYWRELNKTQQDDFIRLFNKLSASTYASRFDSYSGESFTTMGVEELKKGRMLVKTVFKKSDGETVKFDYLLHQKDGNWYIISVIADGVNDLSLKRAEYAAIINDRGFDSLIGEIEKKINELGS
ncbi:MAG TPA: ABC transporter substrate-binding protein [Gammaproteobacteria bacterium]|nr:ABC transporter substrate-binding protein [Gammaproteobacteria bacterium]